MVQQKNGEQYVVVLKYEKFAPELWVNLFSISKALKNGFNEDVVMKLIKGNTTLYFDRMPKSKNRLACSVAKAKQKNSNKDWKGSSITPGERLYADISSIKGESYGGSKFWALVVDDYSGYCWSYFLKEKSDLKTTLIGLLDKFKNLNKTIKFLRLDDTEENFTLEKACKQHHLGL
jgi:hypothetical protein